MSKPKEGLAELLKKAGLLINNGLADPGHHQRVKWL